MLYYKKNVAQKCTKQNAINNKTKKNQEPMSYLEP